MKLCGKTLGWWDQSADLVRTDFAGSISSDCAWGETPFARAVFMMFLVSEVHPFVDGNGRIARIMMSAELAAAGEERIIVPTAYRSNYLTALKPPSQSGQPTPIVRTLDFARKWGAAVPWTDLESTRRVLESCRAFVDPTEADDRGVRLKLPDHALE